MAIFVAPAAAPASAPTAAAAAAPALAPSAAASAVAGLGAQPGAGAGAPAGDGNPRILVGRLTFAVALLFVLLIGGFIAEFMHLTDWNTLLLHSFELLFGAFVGLLGGELSVVKK